MEVLLLTLRIRSQKGPFNCYRYPRLTRLHYCILSVEILSGAGLQGGPKTVGPAGEFYIGFTFNTRVHSSHLQFREIGNYFITTVILREKFFQLFAKYLKITFCDI